MTFGSVVIPSNLSEALNTSRPRKMMKDAACATNFINGLRRILPSCKDKMKAVTFFFFFKVTNSYVEYFRSITVSAQDSLKHRFQRVLFQMHWIGMVCHFRQNSPKGSHMERVVLFVNIYVIQQTPGGNIYWEVPQGVLSVQWQP